MAYEYITKYDSPNYGYPSTAPLSERETGNNKPKEIVIHHWGDDGQSFQGVINWLCNPKSGVSAHYVVEAGKVACIVDCKNPAWHSGNKMHNLQSIGIECRPEATEKDYQTVAELVAYLWKVYGKLPLIRHKDIVATACPGRWDIDKIKKLAEGIYNGDQPEKEPEKKPEKEPEKKPATSSIKLSNEPLYASATAKEAAGKVSGTYYYWDSQVVNGRRRITNAKSRIGKAGQVTGWIAVNKTSKPQLKRGSEVNLKNCPLYASSTITAVASKVSGKYYLWDGKPLNGRYRITNSKNRVGVAGQVTGWINIEDI